MGLVVPTAGAEDKVPNEKEEEEAAGVDVVPKEKEAGGLVASLLGAPKLNGAGEGGADDLGTLLLGAPKLKPPNGLEAEALTFGASDGLGASALGASVLGAPKLNPEKALGLDDSVEAAGWDAVDAAGVDGLPKEKLEKAPDALRASGAGALGAPNEKPPKAGAGTLVAAGAWE